VVLSPLLINHTHKFNVLPTDLKTEAVHCRGQGQGSSRPRPRPQNFVLELSSRSRPVLEDPIPAPCLDYVTNNCPAQSAARWQRRYSASTDTNYRIWSVSTIVHPPVCRPSPTCPQGCPCAPLTADCCRPTVRLVC